MTPAVKMARECLETLLNEAERRSMGFESQWTQAEVYFSFRDHAKSVIDALRALEAEDEAIKDVIPNAKMAIESGHKPAADTKGGE